MPEQEQFWYRQEAKQFGMFWHGTFPETMDAGMLMPALVSSMPIPAYAFENV
jgi:hypothetical protein